MSVCIMLILHLFFRKMAAEYDDTDPYRDDPVWEDHHARAPDVIGNKFNFYNGFCSSSHPFSYMDPDPCRSETFSGSVTLGS
jgi:hypothetical protein